MAMLDTVGVFVDYQNVYNGARRAFGDEKHVDGQVDPHLLGLEVAKGLGALKQVHVYRGMPSANKQSHASAACSRQIAAWDKSSMVTVVPRQLQYPRGWPSVPAKEKGIDVQLAIDFVRCALAEEYDIMVIFSADTDLKPAIEMVSDMDLASCAVAAWNPPKPRFPSRLSFSGGRTVPCRFLDEAAYRRCADRRDYNIRPE